MRKELEQALQAFRDGKPVCLFDSEKREGETDLLFPAEHARPETMRQLRKIVVVSIPAIGHEVGERFGLPFLQDLHTEQFMMDKWKVLHHLKLMIFNTTPLCFHSLSESP